MHIILAQHGHISHIHHTSIYRLQVKHTTQFMKIECRKIRKQTNKQTQTVSNAMIFKHVHTHTPAHTLHMGRIRIRI